MKSFTAQIDFVDAADWMKNGRMFCGWNVKHITITDLSYQCKKMFPGCERVRCATALRLLVCSGALPAEGNGGGCRPADAPSQSLTRGAGLHTSARGGRQ